MRLARFCTQNWTTMLDYQELFEIDPFGLTQKEKELLYQRWINALGSHHRAQCPEYALLSQKFGETPSLPVRLFKEFDLRSVPRDEVVKTLTSSGTTGQQVSKIYLDRDTSARQTKTLTRIVSNFTGSSRMPMIIIDTSQVIKNREMFSARGAGILGFSIFGRDTLYALDENMDLDLEALLAFQEKHAGKQVLLFGFTFMIWQYFCQELLKRGIKLHFDGILIHGGGWKKLAAEQVDNDEFKRIIAETVGIKTVSNYYGMVEQTGSIFMECECGHLHASVFSDIDIIDPKSFDRLATGRGIMQCTSLLPTSYPGHILLTEDEGEILGIDDCPCKRRGKYFTVYGRLPGAEIRGCSDTHERE